MSDGDIRDDVMDHYHWALPVLWPVHATLPLPSRTMATRLVLAILIGIVPLALNALSVSPTRAAPPNRVQNGLIVFMRPGTIGAYDLWVVHPNGTGLRRLTRAPHDRSDYNPTWSPDGARVLFERRVLSSQGDTLYTVPATGGSVHQLTRCSSTCWSHNEGSWSRDGSRIAWSVASGSRSAFSPTKTAIAVMRANGTGVQEITNPPYGHEDHFPVWAPDGRTVVFTRYNTYRGATDAAVVMQVDVATHTTRIVYRFARFVGSNRGFSPDGSRLMIDFWCYFDDCPPTTRTARADRLATIRPDGSGLHILPLRRLADTGVWSPDGTALAFRCRTAVTSFDWRLCTAHVDGSHLRVFPWHLDSVHPSWGTHQ